MSADEEIPLLTLLGDLLGVPAYDDAQIKCLICDKAIAEISNVKIGLGGVPYGTIPLPHVVQFANTFMVHTIREHGGEHAQEVVDHILEQLKKAFGEAVVEARREWQQRDNAPNN